MSKIEPTKIRCTDCNTLVSFGLVESINATIHPDLRNKFFSGNMNDVVCPSCNTTIHVRIPLLLYNDMKNEFAVLYTADEVSGDVENEWSSKKHLVPYFDYAYFLTSDLEEARMLIAYCENKPAPKSLEERDKIASEIREVRNDLREVGQIINWKDQFIKPAQEIGTEIPHDGSLVTAKHLDKKNLWEKVPTTNTRLLNFGRVLFLMLVAMGVLYLFT